MDKESAKEIYREAWNQFLMAGPTRRKELNIVLDVYYKVILGRAKHLGDKSHMVEWETFINSLPGYVEFWQETLAKMMKDLHESGK